MSQRFNKNGAFGAGGRITTPQTKLTVCGKRATDFAEVFGLILERGNRPIARCEFHTARRPVSDHMHGLKIVAACESLGDLSCGRTRRIEDYCLDLRAHGVEDRAGI